MSKPTYIAYNIVETGKTDAQQKPITFWNRVGSAWVNKDGSINLQLSCVPIDGKVHLREPREEGTS